MLTHVEPDAAERLLLSLPAAPETEYIPLDAALDRVLAEDIRAAFPMPPFDKSPFDGFAFRALDVPGKLAVTGETAAGAASAGELSPGTAVHIFTGAPLPKGADATVKIEDTVFTGDTVTISRAFRSGENAIKTGEDFPAGKLLARAGTRLSPSYMGVLASQGLSRVRVFRRPRAAIISTGSELASPGEERPEYGIYNSSLFSISGYLARLGFETVPAGTVEDDAEKIRDLVSRQLRSDADVVFTTGGASVGDYDFAVSTAEGLGAQTLFWKVNMKPGGALLAAQKDGKALISLSGNPAAALMSLLVVAQPYLRALTGGASHGGERLRLPLYRELPKSCSYWRMLRGSVRIEDGSAYFEENLGRGNGNIASFEGCDAIALIPGGSGPLAAGAPVEVLRLPHELCG